MKVLLVEPNFPIPAKSKNHRDFFLLVYLSSLVITGMQVMLLDLLGVIKVHPIFTLMKLKSLLCLPIGLNTFGIV